MNRLFDSRLLQKMTVLFIILAFLFGINQTFAANTKADAIKDWLGSNSKDYPYKEYEYYDNGNLTYGYGVTLPQIPKGSDILYRNGVLYYRTKDSNGNITGETELSFTMKVRIGGTDYSIVIDSNNLVSTGAELKVIIAKNVNGELEVNTESGPVKFTKSQLQSLSIQQITEMGGTSSGDTATTVAPKKTVFEKKGQNIFKKFWEWIKHVVEVIKDWVFDQLTGIVNKLLILIADGLKSLIDGVVGEDLTIAKIVYNKSDKLSIDYWDTNSDSSSGVVDDCPPHNWVLVDVSTSGATKKCIKCRKTEKFVGTMEQFNSMPIVIGNESFEEYAKKVNGEDSSGWVMKQGISSSMRPIITYWYNIFRGFGILVAIIMFLYTAIRILFASTAGGFEDAKKRLISWALGVFILFFFPYVIKYTVILNSCMVELVANKGEAVSNEVLDGENDTMAIVRVMAGSTKNNKYPDVEPMNSLPMSIVYLVLLGQLITLIIVYYKRAFMVAFLITMFPIIATYNMWETTHSGKGNSLKTWTKMFVELVFVQLIHACVYAVFIEGSFDTFDFNEGAGNFILYILCVRFMFSAEKIIKGIFNVRTTGNTLGDFANAGATAMTMASSVKSLVKIQPSKSNAQDKSDEKDLTEQVDQMKENAIGYRTNPNSAAAGATPGGAGGASTRTSLGGSGLGGTVGGGTTAPGTSGPSRAMLEAQKASAVLSQIALRQKNSGIVQRTLNFATNFALKTAGAGLGLAMGLAMGDPTKALSNAVMMKELGGTVAKGVNKITGVAVGRFQGAVMRARFETGGYDTQLEQAGVDVNELYHNARADIIREALAAQMSGTRRGGRALGNVKFTGVIERESRS